MYIKILILNSCLEGACFFYVLWTHRPTEFIYLFKSTNNVIH